MEYYAAAMAATFILCYYQSTAYTLRNGVQAKCFKDFRTAFLVLLPLTFLIITRWDVGVDTLYGSTYWDSYHHSVNLNNVRDFEPGFFWMTVLMRRLRIPFWWYLAVCAFIYMTCMAYALSKGSVWTKWSILVFFLLFVYFDAYNLLRQSIAESISLIAWANMGYYPKSGKQDWKNILIFLLGGMFHATAFINIPLYLICQIRFSRGGLMKFAVFAVLLTPILQIILSFIMQLVAGDDYTFMGFALINAVMTGVLFIICWYYYDDICALDENAYKYANLSLCIFIILLNSGALFLPFRVFDMVKIGYVFIIPYLLRGIKRARERLVMEICLFTIFAVWFTNAFFIQDCAYFTYQSVLDNFNYYANLP